jgi:hypothetical protein
VGRKEQSIHNSGLQGGCDDFGRWLLILVVLVVLGVVGVAPSMS